MQIFAFSILSSCKIAVAISTSLLACGRQQQRRQIDTLIRQLKLQVSKIFIIEILRKTQYSSHSSEIFVDFCDLPPQTSPSTLFQACILPLKIV